MHSQKQRGGGDGAARGNGSEMTKMTNPNGTYTTQGVCVSCGSFKSPQHHGQAPYMPTSCPPSFYPATAPVPLYNQNGGGQLFVLDAQGNMQPHQPMNQGGQQFVFPTSASTVCKESVFPATGLHNSVKRGGGSGKKKRRIRRRTACQKKQKNARNDYL